MRKIKKSLAVLLTVLMLASFTPLFASAATAASKANCVIAEYPQFSYTDPTTNVTVTTDATNTNLTVPAGITYDDIELVGGKITYNDAVVEGYFEWNSRYLTRVPSIGVLKSYYLYFYPTDTTTYSRGTWTVTDLTGWPTITVDGIDCSIETAPTVSGDLPSGNRLSVLSLSGGKVVDSDGNDITASGSWIFINRTSSPTESGPQDVQWIADGYDIPTTTVNVNVVTLKATLAEAPTMSTLTVNENPTLGASRASASTASGGKVVDESGAEITGGTWKVTGYPEGITESTYLYTDTTVTVTWTCTGYESVTAQSTIHVTQGHSKYNIYSRATLTISKQNLAYSPDRTWADDGLIIPAVIKDKNDVDVPGKWEIRNSAYTTTVMDYAIGASTSTKLVYIFFVPDDASLPEYYFTDSIGTVAKADFALSEDSELVLNYGAAIEKPYYGDDFRFSTLKTVPEEAGVYSIGWSVDIFDPATADYGSVTMVEVTVSPESKNYNTMKLTIPIRIQNFVHDINNPWYGMTTNLELSGSTEEAYDGIKNYKIDVTNKRLKGTIDLIINEEVVVSVSPDENGKFFAEGQWIAPASGEYTYRFEYKPSDEDTATVTNPATFDKTLTIELRPYHTLTVNVGDDVYTLTARAGNTVYFSWQDETGLKVEDFGSWVFTDANGNAYTPKYAGGTSNTETVDTTAQPSIYIVMPDHDVVATAKSASILGSFGDADGFDSLCSLWERIKNWLIELYRTIVEFLIPTMESL